MPPTRLHRSRHHPDRGRSHRRRSTVELHRRTPRPERLRLHRLLDSISAGPERARMRLHLAPPGRSPQPLQGGEGTRSGREGSPQDERGHRAGAVRCFSRRADCSTSMPRCGVKRWRCTAPGRRCCDAYGDLLTLHLPAAHPRPGDPGAAVPALRLPRRPPRRHCRTRRAPHPLTYSQAPRRLLTRRRRIGLFNVH